MMGARKIPAVITHVAKLKFPNIASCQQLY